MLRTIIVHVLRRAKYIHTSKRKESAIFSGLQAILLSIYADLSITSPDSWAMCVEGIVNLNLAQTALNWDGVPVDTTLPLELCNLTW